jgi:hypothetical protein
MGEDTGTVDWLLEEDGSEGVGEGSRCRCRPKINDVPGTIVTWSIGAAEDDSPRVGLDEVSRGGEDEAATVDVLGVNARWTRDGSAGILNAVSGVGIVVSDKGLFRSFLRLWSRATVGGEGRLNDKVSLVDGDDEGCCDEGDGKWLLLLGIGRTRRGVRGAMVMLRSCPGKEV